MLDTPNEIINTLKTLTACYCLKSNFIICPKSNKSDKSYREPFCNGFLSGADKRDLNALIVFTEEYLPKRNFVVCNEKEGRLHGKIEVIPWNNFLQQLWAGNIL